jgi:hypothetical protein
MLSSILILMKKSRFNIGVFHKDIIKCISPMVTQFNAFCFKFALLDSALVRSLVGEEFSVSVWDQCHPSFRKIFGRG